MVVNENLVKQHVIQIKNAIMIHVNASGKCTAHAKNIIVGIMAHVFVRIVSV